MTRPPRLPLALLLVSASCAATPGRAVEPALQEERGSAPPGTRSPFDDLSTPTTPRPEPWQEEPPWPPPGLEKDLRPPRWRPGGVALQGWAGVTFLDRIVREGGDVPDVDGSDDDLSRLPMVGGGGQWKLGGRLVDYGFESMIAFSGRADAAAIRIGGGGAAVAVDVDLLILDLSVGPFASVFLGERWRVYGAAGPLVQWAWYDEDAGGEKEDGQGFGTGWYVRGGIELSVRPGLLVGAGVRYLDATIDLDHGLGDLELEGTQAFISVTTGL